MCSINPTFQTTAGISNSSKKKRPSLSLQSQYTPEDDKLNWEWYSPPENSAPVSFCMDTSLHGLKYVGQNKRHISERLFWLTAFITSVTTSAVLIWGMWKDYRDMPIVTVFSPSRKSLEEVPFPSVTICNVNSLPHSAIDKQLSTFSKLGLGHQVKLVSDEMLLQTQAKSLDMDFICDSSATFGERFRENSSVSNIYHRVKLETSKSTSYIEKYLNPAATLINVSRPCEKMILHCVWQDEEKDCSELFKEVITDFGFCCTFNTIPLTLLLKYGGNGHQKYKPDMEKGWKDAQLNYENLMFSEKTKDRKYPYRQRYPGRSAGLSFLINPYLDEYFCTSTDSMGFMMGLNVPLDFPRVKEKGIAIRTSSEVFVGVRPEITMTDESIKSFSLKKRRCYYGNEFHLKYYTMYTASNCLIECIANKTVDKCGCGRYNMPKSSEIKLCMPHQNNCTDNVTTWIMKNGLDSECKECLPTCTEIEYHKEVTTLQPWTKKIDEIRGVNSDGGNSQDISIVHVYFNVDSVYPRVRKEWATITQLMSNTGGLLGLFLGFSVLSLLEIFYYGTLRLCCNFYREKTIRNGKMDNQRSRGRRGSSSTGNYATAVNAKQGWFPKLQSNGARNIHHRTIEDGDGDYMEHVFRVHNNRGHNLPINFQSSFEDQETYSQYEV